MFGAAMIGTAAERRIKGHFDLPIYRSPVDSFPSSIQLVH